MHHRNQMRARPSRGARAAKSHGVTLIEVLVVIGIIALLTSILLPVLSTALYSARQIQCVSNMHNQYLAQIAYATDNKGNFPLRAGSPDYQRFGWGSDAVTPLLGKYISDTNVMICPIIAQIEQASSSDLAYGSNDWTLAGGYGGWNTNEPYVYTAYMWFANFQGASMVNGEPNPPKSMRQLSNRGTFITHRLSFYSGTMVHEICHGGRGIGQVGSPTNYHCSDMPVCYGDGSISTHHQSDIVLHAYSDGCADYW